MQRIPESSCVRKETVGRDILATFLDGLKKQHLNKVNRNYCHCFVFEVVFFPMVRGKETAQNRGVIGSLSNFYD